MKRMAGGAPGAAQARDPPIREYPPSCQEVETVASELKGYRAAGVCEVPAELQGGWRRHDAMVAYCNSKGVIHRCCPQGMEKRPSPLNL